MRLQIKNKFLSWGGASKVTDVNKKEVYKVKGKVFTFTKKKKMYDMEGNLLYVIRNKYWTVRERKVLIFDADGELVATVKKDKWDIGHSYDIIDTEDDMSIDGRFLDPVSYVKKNGKTVASITRDIAFTDTFILETEEKNIAFYVALVIAFDNMKDMLREEKD